MIRAYLYALDPSPAQIEAFRSHCGAQRVAYNWALARVQANWAQRVAEQTYGLVGDQLTPWVTTSAYGLRAAWNTVKDTVAPWWAENSKEAYASGREPGIRAEQLEDRASADAAFQVASARKRLDERSHTFHRTVL